MDKRMGKFNSFFNTLIIMTAILLLALSLYCYANNLFTSWHSFANLDRFGASQQLIGQIIASIILMLIMIWILILCLKKKFEAAIMPVAILTLRGVIFELAGFPIKTIESSAASLIKDQILISIALCFIPILIFVLVLLYLYLPKQRIGIAIASIGLMLTKPILIGLLRNSTYTYTSTFSEKLREFSGLLYSLFANTFAVGDAITFILIARRNPNASYIFENYILALVIFLQSILLILLMIRGINKHLNNKFIN